MLTKKDILDQSVALQKEGSDIEEHDKCLKAFVQTFGNTEGNLWYAQAVIDFNRMIEL